MDDDNKLFVTLILGLAGILATAILAGLAINNYNERHMAELGYEETTVPGHQSLVWRKAD
jgi:hypothetical protein